MGTAALTMPAYKRPRKVPVRGRKRRTTTRATMRMTRPVRPPVPNQMLFKRRQWWGTQQVTNVAVSGYWVNWSVNLDNMPNYTEITNLFDQYKINAIKITYVPQASEAATATASSYPRTQVLCCYDSRSTVCNLNSGPTGAYGSATLNRFMEQGRIKTFRRRSMSDPIDIYIRRPQIQFSANNTVTNNWQNSRYLPTTSPSVGHQLCNVFFVNPGFGPSGETFDIYVTWYITAKNTK